MDALTFCKRKSNADLFDSKNKINYFYVSRSILDRYLNPLSHFVSMGLSNQLRI